MAIDKAVDSSQLNADLKAIADAIRTKGGTNDELTFPDGFVDAVGAIQAGGSGSSQLVALMADELEEFTDPQVIKLAANSVRGRKTLKTINLPNCTSFDGNTFDSCSNLTTLSLPRVVSASGYPVNACIDCISLVTAYLPVLLSIPSQMFYRCKSLKTIIAPAVTTLAVGTFQESGIEEYINPGVITMGNNIFKSCTLLRKVDISNSAWKFESGVFYGATALETLIIRSTTMRTLDSINCFYNTPIKAGAGYIYVPSAVIDEYKAATNWSVFADQFRAIEEYPEITGG